MAKRRKTKKRSSSEKEWAPVKIKHDKRVDLFKQCNDMGEDPQVFMQTWCNRCRNYSCVNADWANSTWERRMSTQRDRLLDNPNFADPESSRYEDIRKLEFKDMLREAIILNEAERTWQSPEEINVSQAAQRTAKRIQEHLAILPAIPASDETQRHVDEAVKALSKARKTKSDAPSEEVDRKPPAASEPASEPTTEHAQRVPAAFMAEEPPENIQPEQFSVPTQPVVESTVQSTVKSAVQPGPKPVGPVEPKPVEPVQTQQHVQRTQQESPDGSPMRNTAVPQGGIMLGEGPPPSQQDDDPWAPKKRISNQVKNKAVIKMGK